LPEYKDTLDDFNLKWAQTYALLNDKVIYCHGAHYDEEDRDPQVYVDIVRAQTKERLLNFDFNSLTPLLFDSQFFNGTDFKGAGPVSHETACLHIARSSRRQNKRSLSMDNTAIISPYYPVISQIQSRWPNHYSITFKHIENLMAGKFPQYQEALTYCLKYLMVAISPNFAVALSNISTDKYLLASQFGFIGEADRTTLYIHHKGSYQEVRDFVQRNNLDLQVLHAK
jgi:hypothetical protein